MAIAEAITEAHRHNVQHRDLKPANVLLPHDGRVRVVDFGLALELHGCDGFAASLTVDSGLARAGDQLNLSLDDAQSNGASSVFFLSNRGFRTGECGIPTPGGELLALPPFGFMTSGPIWNGTPALLSVDIPNNICLVDSEWFGQAAFFDGTNPEPVRLTNGMRFEIGAP